MENSQAQVQTIAIWCRHCLKNIIKILTNKIVWMFESVIFWFSSHPEFFEFFASQSELGGVFPASQVWKIIKHQITFDIFIVLNILNIQSYGSFNVDERSGRARAAVRSDVRSVTGGGGVRSALGSCWTWLSAGESRWWADWLACNMWHLVRWG